jgi:hypothetical protein
MVGNNAVSGEQKQVWVSFDFAMIGLAAMANEVAPKHWFSKMFISIVTLNICLERS